MDFELVEGVTMESVDGNAVLITEKGDAAILNETAARILGLLSEDVGFDEAVGIVASEYLTDESTAAADAKRLLGTLSDKGLIWTGLRRTEA